MEALHKELAVHVEGAAPLTFQKTIHGVDASKHAPSCCSIAAKSVGAWLAGSSAVRAVEAKPQAKDMPQGEEHQNLKPIGTG